MLTLTRGRSRPAPVRPSPASYGRHVKRITRLLCVLILVVSFSWFPGTARACACGALITDSGAGIDAETALIVLDDNVETIDMVMRLTSDASTAAWIMPVPADTTISLGNQEAFATLATVTAPKPVYIEDWIPRLSLGDSGPARDSDGRGPVEVVSVQTVGPFDVTTLNGADAQAVNQWLEQHGFPTRPDIEPVFAQYLGNGWNIAAVKLIPDSTQEHLRTGDLPPLRMKFSTDKPIYPIKLSQRASIEQRIQLYIAAGHRVDASGPYSTETPLQLRFTGAISGTDIGLGDRQWYLTSYGATLSPDLITSDITFTRSATDEPYQATYPVHVYRGDITLAALVIGTTILIAGVYLTIWRRTSRHRKQADSN